MEILTAMIRPKRLKQSDCQQLSEFLPIVGCASTGPWRSTALKCVRVKLSTCRNSFLITPRIRTKLVSVNRLAPTIPATAMGILLRTAKTEHRPFKPTCRLPHKKPFSIFQSPFASVRRMPSEARSRRGKRRIDRFMCKCSS